MMAWDRVDALAAVPASVKAVSTDTRYTRFGFIRNLSPESPVPVTVAEIDEFLDRFAPPALAEEWDNVGLLLGDRHRFVRRILTCLTLTPDVADEAIDTNADLIVSHHPILFRPVQRVTSDHIEGAMLLKLIRAGIAVISPHTRFDSAVQGINQQLAEGFGLQGIRVLRPLADGDPSGAGRFGTLPSATTLEQFLPIVRRTLPQAILQYVGDLSSTVYRIGVACGSAASFLDDAVNHACDTFVTGESTFHSCLAARHKPINMILTGHFASERPAVEWLADRLAEAFPEAECSSSVSESDPLTIFPAT